MITAHIVLGFVVLLSMFYAIVKLAWWVIKVLTLAFVVGTVYLWFLAYSVMVGPGW